MTVYICDYVKITNESKTSINNEET